MPKAFGLRAKRRRNYANEVYNESMQIQVCDKRHLWLAPYTLFLCIFALMQGCQSRPTSVNANFGSENVKQLLDKATLVLLAKAGPVSIKKVASLHQIDVRLQIIRVLKGQYSMGSACFVYYLPAGAYEGPYLPLVKEGTTGIFTLRPDGRCFRAVNDRWAIIPAYRVPDDSAPLEEFVAKATLPVYGGCANPAQADNEVLGVTRRLIGHRATLKLLESALGDSDPDVRICSCLVLTGWWNSNESCLRTVPSTVVTPTKADEIRLDYRRSRKTQLDRFHADPVSWLKNMMAGGLDGTVSLLYDLTARPNVSVDPGTCHLIRNGLLSGAYDSVLGRALYESPEAAERRAMEQFKMWLDSDCPANFEPLRTPAAPG